MESSWVQILDVVIEFVYAPSLLESKRILDSNHDLLLTDAADEVLVSLLAQSRNNEKDTQILEGYRTLLARCRYDGIDAAFADMVDLRKDTSTAGSGSLVEIVMAFVNAQTWAESKDLLEAHHNVLLTDAADEVLVSLLEQYKDNENTTYQFEEYRMLLANCRNYMREYFPVFWAMAQYNLGIAYLERLRGERAENLEEAIRYFQRALEIFTPEGSSEDWARIQYNLGIAYLERLRGERAENLEEAIRHFTHALEVYKRGAFHEQWGAIQDRLVRAYSDRIGGDSAENLAEAVIAYLNAQTRTEAKRSVEAYSDLLLTEAADEVLVNLLDHNRDDEHAVRILEENRDVLRLCRREGIGVAFEYMRPSSKSHHGSDGLDAILEELPSLTSPSDMPRAIHLLRTALEVFGDDIMLPDLWAELHAQLGENLADLPQGDRAENLEEAIRHYERALEIFTPEGYPEDWAEVQMVLANTYLERLRGERAENLEEAIRHHERALEVFTREAFPEDWARVQMNLANAYSGRIRGERAENLEEALSCYERALEVFTREAFPEDWAAVQHNLANAYLDRVLGERARNLEEAIRHCERALEVFTPEGYPEYWAKAESALASAYSSRVLGMSARNLEEAIRHHERALEVFTREAFPEDWAAVQLSLANAYSNHIRGERAENLEEALSCYERALEVFTREAFPERWALVQHNLATAFSERIWGERHKNLKEAIHHFRQAIKVRTVRAFPRDCLATALALANLLFHEHRIHEARVAFTWAHRAVEALRGEIQRESAKRALAEQNEFLYAHLVHCCLLEGDEEAAFRYAVAGKGRAFVDMLATARFDLPAAEADDPELAADLRQARALRQQIDKLLTQLSGVRSIPHGAERGSRREMYADLRTLRTQDTALWEKMAYKYPALTATQQAPVFGGEEASVLAADLDATLVEYYQHAGGWCAFVVTPDGVQRVNLYGIDEKLFDRILKWLVRIESPTGRGKLSYEPLRRLHEALFAPLRAHLPLDGAIVLAPFSHLHLVPLAAALDPATGRYAAEDYLLAFAPSLAALRVTLDQVRQASFADAPSVECLLSVAYPGDPRSPLYLPNVLPEAEAVARHFTQVTPLHQDAATPDAVLSRSRDQDVVHFGCHGTFDPETPEQSGLVLSGGWLTVRRIISELRLSRTRLATLGACLSGRVEVRRGEEHVGILQALMSAGARAVVASLWPVHDAATRALFEVFYAEIAAGDAPARALVDAGWLVRNRPGWEHPYYWAAFQVNGLAHGPHEPELSHLSDELMRRIEKIHHESVRGGSIVNVAETVRDGQVLLEQMTEEPEAVLKVLDPEEQTRVVTELRTLDGRAGGVRTEADLLYVADAIHRLVEETPALAALLLPQEMDVQAAQNQRKIIPAYHEVTSSESQYAQEHAAQIRNHVIECRKELEQALQRLSQMGSGSDL
jgi:tetratricopeptide (TPR) repeat protein